MPFDQDPPADRVRTALDGYGEDLRRSVAATLIRPRNPIPDDELTDRILGTLANPPVVDRRIADLPPAARRMLAVFGLTRQPRWKVGHLVTVLAAVGHAEGFTPVQALLDAGLVYPDRPPTAPPLSEFAPWLGQSGTLDAAVFAHPMVAARAADVPFDLPDLGAPIGDAVAPRVADGLEWLLRLAAATQLVAETPVRRTQANALFKRDLTRLQTHELLASAPSDHLVPLPDAGVLALVWAAAAGYLADEDGELRSVPARPHVGVSLTDAIAELVAGLAGVESWDPLLGYHVLDGGLSPFPSAAVCCFLLLARAGGWVAPADVARWLWEHHPSWQGVLAKDAQKDHGAAWAEAFLLGVAYPLRLVEAVDRDGPRVRLTDLGRHLFAAGPKPADPPAFPHTLMVQPNAEILAYRQGLTPPLIEKLTRFARWKSLGAACTLELTPEHTYRGLEAGLTLAGIVQALNQHGTRPVPPPVTDLLQRWANKRERIGVYSAATLVEFQSSADLDSAVSRGIVAVRVTDRIGLCATGGDPEFKHLRLVGNRDYDTRPTRCLAVADDGVTLTVDAAQSDLLFEAEIGRMTEPVDTPPDAPRRFRLTHQSLTRCLQGGWSLDELDAWFVARTGFPLSPAGRLFVKAAGLPPSLASKRLVLQLPTPEAADGLMQWPRTRSYLEDRLGPTAVVVDEANLPHLTVALAELGLRVEMG